jgi:predicted CopG family antitoxin
MARQIAVSNEVYAVLSKMKDGKSFSELLLGILKGRNRNIMKYAGILKGTGVAASLKEEIKKERKAVHGRF